MEKKVTSEEVVLALEICSGRKENLDCAGCPLENGSLFCIRRLLKESLVLIKRLKAGKEPESLKEDYELMSERTKKALESIRKGDQVEMYDCFEAEIFKSRTFEVETEPLRMPGGRWAVKLKSLGYYDVARLRKVDKGE